MTAPEAGRVIEAVWRLESLRIIASLTRLVRDVGLAEDLAQDAFVSAVEEWPLTGVPPNPGGWLMLTARHRAIDRLRRDDRLRANLALLGHEVADRARTEVFADDTDEAIIQDDILRLVFIACHPILPTASRVALTLRLIGGLSTDEIARAFLVPETTVAQRIVRAKRALADHRVAFEVPEYEEMMGRLASVLEVVYLIFNEGHSATAGEEWLRPELCQEALRLGRMLAELAPSEPEVHGLVALMEIQSSRLRARVDRQGRPIPLLKQNRGRWDQLLIRRGFTAMLRARELGRPAGPYVLQAAIAACHARAHKPEETNWPAIVMLYETLAQIRPSPVVELNHAVAVGMASGPEAGLRLVDTLTAQPALATYHLLPAVRGDLLARLGRVDEARHDFLRAAELTANERERSILTARADDVRVDRGSS